MSTDTREIVRPNCSIFYYFGFTGEDPYSDAEIDAIRKDVEEWSAENEMPCEVERTANGFEVKLHHFCADGFGFGNALFRRLLKKNTFSSLSRGVMWGFRGTRYTER